MEKEAKCYENFKILRKRLIKRNPVEIEGQREFSNNKEKLSLISFLDISSFLCFCKFVYRVIAYLSSTVAVSGTRNTWKRRQPALYRIHIEG